MEYRLNRNLTCTIFSLHLFKHIFRPLYFVAIFYRLLFFYVLFVPTKSTQKALRTENLNVKCLRRFLGAAELATLKRSSHLFQKTPNILLIFLSRTNEQPNDFYLLQQYLKICTLKKFNGGSAVLRKQCEVRSTVS